MDDGGGGLGGTTHGGRALLAVVSGEGRGGHSAGTAYRAAVFA